MFSAYEWSSSRNMKILSIDMDDDDDEGEWTEHLTLEHTQAIIIAVDDWLLRDTYLQVPILHSHTCLNLNTPFNGSILKKTMRCCRYIRYYQHSVHHHPRPPLCEPKFISLVQQLLNLANLAKVCILQLTHLLAGGVSWRINNIVK